MCLFRVIGVEEVLPEKWFEINLLINTPEILWDGIVESDGSRDERSVPCIVNWLIVCIDWNILTFSCSCCVLMMIFSIEAIVK